MRRNSSPMLFMRVVLLAAVLAGFAFGADFFPLQMGNTWIYQGHTSGLFVNGTETFTITVAGTKEFNGVSYFVLRQSGMHSDKFIYSSAPFDRYLRPDDSGTIFEYDPVKQAEKIAYSLQASNAYINRNLVGPLGTFDNAVLFGYFAFQQGLFAEYFLPYVGMIRRSFADVVYTIQYDLVYAQLSGQTVFSAPQISFSLSLDHAFYHSGDTLTATIAFLNTEKITLSAPTYRLYELVINDGKGNAVYRLSDKQPSFPFPKGTKVDLTPWERNAVLPTPLLDSNGYPLPAGDYTAEAYLTTEGAVRYRATVGFTIQ